ncbi:MAG TPA: polyphosphate kinase 2, partial [Solirubrobacteraceae bacterium]|nr:polyphosphate kinase 2 [Solirubrobacteraceae bacterium]
MGGDSERRTRDEIRRELIDSVDEELEMELDDARAAELAEFIEHKAARDTIDRNLYFNELFRLQGELVKLQDWVVNQKLKIVVIFEGRDAAGKGGVIKRITQRLNPRICRIATLPAPNERERTQWYFQRYVSHLPAGGEIVLFDRSWYNRAGVERVMGFCTDEDVEEFLRTVPEFERMLVRSGIVLIKYWFSITDDEQHFRFMMRVHDPLKQWKLSPMDLESRRRWEAYTKAKEAMLERTSIAEARWWIVEADDKKRARLNCIQHLLSSIPTRRCCAIPSCCPHACTTQTICALRCRRKCMCRQSISGRSVASSPVPQRSAQVIQFGTRKKICGPWNRGLPGGFSPH